MNILAVDTSSQDLLVAVKTDSYYEESVTKSMEFKHSERIMDVVLELLSHAGIKTTDIDLFACTRGPGSFTGLRIGMAALKGMAFGSGKPLVSVSTLEMWANTVKDFNGLTVACLDAKKQRYYIGAFKCSDGKVLRLLPDTDGNTCNLETVIAEYDNVLVTGPDRESFSSLLEESFPEKNIVSDGRYDISASSSLIELALKQFNEKGPDDIGQGPVYLRKSDAEIAYEEKLKAEDSHV